MKKNHILAAFLLAFTFLLITASVVQASADPVERSRIERLKAIKKSCSIIGTIYKDCMDGDASQCERLETRSYPWFQNEFKGLPDVVCHNAAKNNAVFLDRL